MSTTDAPGPGDGPGGGPDAPGDGPPSLVPLPAATRWAGAGPVVAAGLRVEVAAPAPDAADVAEVVTERLRRAGVPDGPVPVRLALEPGDAPPVPGGAAPGRPGPGPAPTAPAGATDRTVAAGEAPDPPVSAAGPGEPAPASSAYRLEVTATEVRLTAAAPEGLLAGSVTLAQVLAQPGPDGRAAGGTIVDAPRFAWRGLCLDVARRYFPVADVLRVVDLMADLRLNVLHLHLTDDQAWRLALPSRPELTERSSGTGCGGGPGGSYSAADLATIVDRATRLGVVVVPEIDVPGHTNAALHAYGELNEGGEPAPEYTGMEVGFSQLREQLPATDPFLRDVFTDLAAMTPGPWLHLGGDEPLVMDPDEYVRVVDRAVGHVVGAGKHVVTWQEGAVADLPPGAVVQYWDERVAPGDTPAGRRNAADDVVAAVGRGARLLLSPASRVYLDMVPEAGFPLGQDWAGVVGLEDVYGWEPLDVLPVPADRVLGIEAAVFTETLRTFPDLTVMLLPRLAAVAEVAWTPADRRDLADFRRRVAWLSRAWDAAGLAWHRDGVGWDGLSGALPRDRPLL